MKKLCILFVLGLLALDSHAARSFTRASSHYLIATPPTLTMPYSVSAWMYTTDLATSQVIVAVWSAGTNTGSYLIFRGADAGDKVGAVMIGTSSTSAEASSTGAVASGVWHHTGAVYASTTSRSVYLDGSKDTVTNSINTPNNPTSIEIGRLPAGAYFNGFLGEVAIWNVALNDEEMLSLSKGRSALLIRPSALIFYAPLWRNIFDYRAAISITNNGTSAADAHPRRYR